MESAPQQGRLQGSSLPHWLCTGCTQHSIVHCILCALLAITDAVVDGSRLRLEYWTTVVVSDHARLTRHSCRNQTARPSVGSDTQRCWSSQMLNSQPCSNTMWSHQSCTCMNGVHILQPCLWPGGSSCASTKHALCDHIPAIFPCSCAHLRCDGDAASLAGRKGVDAPSLVAHDWIPAQQAQHRLLQIRRRLQTIGWSITPQVLKFTS